MFKFYVARIVTDLFLATTHVAQSGEVEVMPDITELYLGWWKGQPYVSYDLPL